MAVTDSYSQLKRDEGEVLSAYQDHLGYWTIGVGILIDSRKNGALRPEESEFIFNNRLRLKRAELEQRLPFFKTLDDARQGVLLNMAYQLGTEGLLAFKQTLKSVEQGAYLKASQQMLDSLWARQTPKRAERLSEQMAKGVWV